MIYDLHRRLWRKASKPINLAIAAGSADSYLASYPKSGRTWFRFILSNYFNTASQLGVSVDLHSMFRILPNFDFDPVRGIPAFAFRGSKRLPLILVTHENYRPLLFRGVDLVFMVRDPRDVLVSAFFHATRHKHRFEGDISQFLADREQGLPALIRYLNGWAAGLSRQPHFVLSYERLTAEPEAATAEVLRFLGCVVNEDAVRDAVAASRFEAMRDHELEEGIPSHDYDRSDSESLRMRRGQVGGFSDYLSPVDVRFIDEACSSGLSHAAKNMVRKTGMILP
jgi:alcohol sulfotransferase